MLAVERLSASCILSPSPTLPQAAISILARDRPTTLNEKTTTIGAEGIESLCEGAAESSERYQVLREMFGSRMDTLQGIGNGGDVGAPMSI